MYVWESGHKPEVSFAETCFILAVCEDLRNKNKRKKKNLIKNLLSLKCQYVPSFSRPYFARLEKSTRFLFAGVYTLCCDICNFATHH